MKARLRLALSVLALALPVAAQVPGPRQSAGRTRAVESTQPATRAAQPTADRSARPSRALAPVVAPNATRSGQRQQSPPSAPSVPARRSISQPAPARNASAPVLKLYDRQGRVLNGYKQVTPNRVLDVRTGRYHDTTPMGDGQRIVR